MWGKEKKITKAKVLLAKKLSVKPKNLRLSFLPKNTKTRDPYAKICYFGAIRNDNEGNYESCILFKSTEDIPLDKAVDIIANAPHEMWSFEYKETEYVE